MAIIPINPKPHFSKKPAVRNPKSFTKRDVEALSAVIREAKEIRNRYAHGGDGITDYKTERPNPTE